VRHTSIRIIREEHASLGAMLASIRLMIEHGPKDEPEVFFDVLRAMLFYIDEVPEKQHHIKETELLFPPIAKRSPQCAELIDRLDKDHHKGESSVRELQHLLLAWEMLGDSRRTTFEDAVKEYLAFYNEHIRLEESIIIPEAMKVLTEEDWKQLDAAFEKNCDPLSGSTPRDPLYDRLFTKITIRAPEPIGLGRRM
jgi:hemerythrin-like domain-containing protein